MNLNVKKKKKKSMLAKITQLLTKLKSIFKPKPQRGITITPIDRINKHDRAYKKTHWV